MAEPPVANVSPFIIRALSGRLDLLRLAGEPILLPRAVELEIRRGASHDAAVVALETLDWVQVVEAGTPAIRLQRYRLGAGDTAVLTWALSHPDTVAILDDQRGRQAARALGIPVRGTLGLIADAKLRGIIPAARPVIEQVLASTGWYLSPSVMEAVLAEIGE